MWRYVIACVVLGTLTAAQGPPADPRCNLPTVRIRFGFGYLPILTRCDAFVRCSYADAKGAVKSQVQICGCGKFWNDDLMTCVPALDQVCAADPCASASVNAYPFVGNCRSYWSCDGSRTGRGMCCDEGFRFDGTQTCVADPTCTDFCNCYDTTTESPLACPFGFNPADHHTYFVTVHGERTIMSCAPGTNYNRTACRCSDFVQVARPKCAKDFDLQCDTGKPQDRANRAYIMEENVNVNVVLGQCLFNGDNSELLIPRYANMDWRYEWAVRVGFSGQNNPNNNGPLYSNSACVGAAPSVNLRLIREGGVATVEATINTPAATRLTVVYNANERNDVYLWYNGVTFNLCIKYEDARTASDSQPATGLTTRVHCTVRYGQDENNNVFQGVIFETQVYVYCVPDNFCGS